MTVDGLVAMLGENYGVELSMLSSGVTILYSDFMDRKKMKVLYAFLLRSYVCCVCYFRVCACVPVFVLVLFVCAVLALYA